MIAAGLCPHIGLFFMPLDEIALKARPRKRRNTISEIILEESINTPQQSSEGSRINLVVDGKDLPSKQTRTNQIIESIDESPEEHTP